MTQWDQIVSVGPSVTGLARVEGENATYTRAADKSTTAGAGLRGQAGA